MFIIYLYFIHQSSFTVGIVGIVVTVGIVGSCACCWTPRTSTAVVLRY